MRRDPPRHAPQRNLSWGLYGTLCGVAACAGSSTVTDAGDEASAVDAGQDAEAGAEGGDPEAGGFDSGPEDASIEPCGVSGVDCASRCAPGISAGVPEAALADGQAWVVWEGREAKWSDVCAARYDISAGKLAEASQLNDAPFETFAHVQSASSESGTLVVSWREDSSDGDRLLVSRLAGSKAQSPAAQV